MKRKKTFVHIARCDVHVSEIKSEFDSPDNRSFQLISNGCLVEDPFVQRNACELPDRKKKLI